MSIGSSSRTRQRHCTSLFGRDRHSNIPDTPTKKTGKSTPLQPSSRKRRRVSSPLVQQEGDDSSEDDSSDTDNSEDELTARVDAKDATFAGSQGDSSDEDTAITSEDEDDPQYASNSDEEQTHTPQRRRRGKTEIFTPNKKRRTTFAGTPGGRERILKTVSSTLRLPARPLNMSSMALEDIRGLSATERAKKLLHVGATPEQLPCRQDQYEEVMAYVEDALLCGTGQCVYVAGVPGVGKTATVREAIRTLQVRSMEGVLPAFQFVEINGMKLNDAQDAYGSLWQTMSGHRCSNKMALRRLSQHFQERRYNRSTDDTTTTVVLMDELDQLVTSRQEVMYNMFNWPHSQNSRLVVIAVANTMDLPERMLNAKVASRLGMTRIIFRPYNDKQLVEIVQTRLGMDKAKVVSDVERELIKGCDKVFEEDAIVYVSKRVSNVSGDARRMLDVCRRAIDSVESKNGTAPRPVTINDVKKVLDSMVKSGKVSHIIKLSKHAKILLISILACARKTGIAETDFASILAHQRSLCHSQGIANYLDLHTSSSMIGQLCGLGLIIAVGSGAGNARAGMHARFLLACQEDEVRLALEQDPDEKLRNMM